MQDAVTVVGYPIGGDTMSVTSGVVSRIEVTSYVHGAAELLGIQIDAAVSVYRALCYLAHTTLLLITTEFAPTMFAEWSARNFERE
jgi:hypothetical protein